MFIQRYFMFFLLLFVFYGLANNEGFHIKPTKIKVGCTIVFMALMLPIVFFEKFFLLGF